MKPKSNTPGTRVGPGFRDRKLTEISRKKTKICRKKEKINKKKKKKVSENNGQLRFPGSHLDQNNLKEFWTCSKDSDLRTPT